MNNELSNNKVIGKKQTMRLLLEDEVKTVYIAKDADSNVTSEVIELCKNKGVDLVYIDKMSELGELCGIEVNAATAAVLK